MRVPPFASLKLVGLFSSVLIVSACGGGSSSSSNSNSNSSSSATFTLGGVVIENSPVANANVCVSTKTPFTCDSNSVTTTTSASGTYTLGGVVLTNNTQLLVTVPASTDPQSKKNIPQHQISAAAVSTTSNSSSTESMIHPIHAAHSKSATSPLTVNISPFTTLITQQMYTLGLSENNAAITVANLIGNSITVSQLTQNYIGTSLPLQNIATTIAYQLGNISGQVATTLTTTPTPAQIGQTAVLAANYALLNLNSISTQVYALASNTSVDPSTIHVSPSPIAATVTATTIATVLAQQTPSATIPSAFSSGSLFVPVQVNSTSGYQPGYITYTTGTSGSGSYTGSASYYPNSATLVTPFTYASVSTTPPSSYILMNTSLVPNTLNLPGLISADMSLANFDIVTTGSELGFEPVTGGSNPATGLPIPIEIFSIDLSGQSEYAFVNSYFNALYSTSGTPTLAATYKLTSASTTTFPAGAMAFSLVIPPGAPVPTQYFIYSSTVANTATTNSLAQLVTDHQTPTPLALYPFFPNFSSTSTSATVSAQFGNSGSVNLLFSNGTSTPTPIASTYTIANANSTGPSVLSIAVPQLVSSILTKGSSPISYLAGSTYSFIFAMDPNTSTTADPGISLANYQSLPTENSMGTVVLLNQAAINALTRNICSGC